MIGKIMQGMLAAIMGAIAFLIVKELVSSMDTTGWSDAEISAMTVILPLVIAFAAVIAVLMGIQSIAGQ